MPAPIMSNAAATVRSQIEHLGFPSVRAQRPSMAKCNDRTCAPVFIVDPCSVFGLYCTHRFFRKEGGRNFLPNHHSCVDSPRTVAEEKIAPGHIRELPYQRDQVGKAGSMNTPCQVLSSHSGACAISTSVSIKHRTDRSEDQSTGCEHYKSKRDAKEEN